MRTCAAKVQLPSECQISDSCQSTYFDAVALHLEQLLEGLLQSLENVGDSNVSKPFLTLP